MNARQLLFGLLLLTSCSKSPEEYRLSAEQLVWQPYRVGQVLRFGHAQDSKVRAYQITEVNDQLEKSYQMAVIGLPFKAPERYYQRITVEAQRTDTVAMPRQILSMRIEDHSGQQNPPLKTTVEWEPFFGALLPIDEINKGLPIDTIQYGSTELLPSATLGPATYLQVVHFATRSYNSPPAGPRGIHELYYARNQGLVGYREVGTGLWYRLP